MNRIPASRITSLAVASALFAVSAIAPALAAELAVDLHGIRAQAGLVTVVAVDSKDAWDGKAAPLQGEGAPPQGEDASFTFRDLKPGTYAVLITHDENGNGKLDTNVMGMPLEGYGFSNNPQ